jgi:hypothetical protein
VAQKFDGSKYRSYPGRPRIAAEVEALIVQLARDNSGWGYDRIAGALAHLGHEVSDQTVGNVLCRHGIAPAPKRSQTTARKDFIGFHMEVMSGMDFFTAEVPDVVRSGHVLRSVCGSTGNEASDPGRHDPPSDRGVAVGSVGMAGGIYGLDRGECPQILMPINAAKVLLNEQPRRSDPALRHVSVAPARS